MNKENLIEIIKKTKEWFEAKKQLLEQVANRKEGDKIIFEGKSGKSAELPARDVPGFKLGIKIALELLGDFPVKVSEK